MRYRLPHKPWRLNLGCGRDYKKDWINLDAIADFQPDIIHDLSKPLPFPDSSVNQVLAQDILEHFTKEDGLKFLSEIARVLQWRGQLILRLPNIDQIITQFEDDKIVRNEFLYGTTSLTGVFGAHKAGYTLAEVQAILLCLNLKVISVSEEATNWLIVVQKQKTRFNPSITWVSQTFGMGGAEVFTAELLAWFNQQGWRVEAYVTYLPFLQFLRQKGITAHHLPIALDVIGDWKGLLKALVLLWPAMIQYGWLSWQVRHHGVLLMSGYVEKIIMTLWAQLTKQAVVWIEFGPLETVHAKFFGLPKLIYFLAKNLPQYIVVPSAHTRAHLISGSGVSLAKLKIIPCASLIKFIKKKRQKKLVVCVSRLEAGKGQDVLIQAWIKVQKKHPDARLQIVGAMTDFGRQLQRLVERLRLTQSVEFTDYVHDVRPYLARASMAVFPSMWPLEGFGLVMIEAMAFGVPVVAFQTGPAPEILDSGRAGFLVKKLSVDGLSDAIIKLIDQPNLATKLGQSGQKRYKTNYTFDQVGSAYAAVLHRTLADSQIKSTAKANDPIK